MMSKIFYLLLCFVAISIQLHAASDKKDVPPIEDSWVNKNADGDRSLSQSPSLFKDANFVYVYSEKQLDNLYIGITDMMGNVVYEETTTVPACVYYAVSIESLPAGSYYISIIQGSKYVIGVFVKE